MLKHYFDQRYFITDSEPEVTAIAYLANGQVLKLHSATQAMYALPWTITLGSITYRSYNPKLSTALAALLPAEDLNHDFLKGGGIPLGAGTFEFGCR